MIEVDSYGNDENIIIKDEIYLFSRLGKIRLSSGWVGDQPKILDT